MSRRSSAIAAGLALAVHAVAAQAAEGAARPAPAEVTSLACPIDPRLAELLPPGSAPMMGVLPVTPQLFPSQGPDWTVLPGCSFALERAGVALADDPLFAYRLRSLVGVSGLLGFEVANYWIGREENAIDWELSWSWPSWEKKVFGSAEGVSFDTNRFETNTVWHPVAGTLYYLAARGNSLSLPESYAVSFLASLFWEYVAEYREKVSINDVIMTPAAGVAIGEPAHQIALFLERSPSQFHRTMAALFSPFHALIPHEDPVAERVDELGLPDEGWHRFQLFLGGAVHLEPGLGASEPESQLGLSAEMISVPELEQPVAVQRALPPGSSFEMSLQAGLGGGDLVELDASSQVSLGGYLWQDLAPGKGGPSGYHLSLGGVAGYSYTMHAWSPELVDKLGVAKMAGLALDLGLDRGGVHVHAGLDAFVDFAAVRSMAIDDLIARDGADGLRLVLSERRYYFAVGTTLRPALSVAYRGAEVGGAVELDLFESLEGLDRYQASVRRDIDLGDARVSHRLWLSYTPPGDRIRISLLSLEARARSGHAGGVRAAREETRALAGFGLLW